MKSFRSAIILLISIALTLPAFQDKPAATKPERDITGQVPEKASIEGVAIDAVQGKPVKDASLLLVRNTGGGTPITVKSDENGHFLFKDLEAGTYILIGDHPRYARQSFGSRNGLLGATPLTIVAAQHMKDITFKLQANAIASGKVTDEDGEPVPKVLVIAAKGMYQRGKRQQLPVGTSMTNDLGEFRISNLAAGRYILSATMFNQPGVAAPAKPAGDAPEQTYIPTYYPNVTDASSAANVEITAGRDVGGLDIRLLKAKSVRVKGQVNGLAKDQKVNVRLSPKGAGLMSMLTGRTASVKQPEGTFEISGATPGSYILSAVDQSGTRSLGAGVPVEVGDHMVDNLAIDITPSAELKGIVEVKGDTKPSLSGTRVFLELAEGMTVVPPTTTMAEDGTFTLKDVPADKYLVRLLNTPPNAYVESVRLGDQDMTDQGLNLGGSNGGKLEIKLNLNAAQVDGVVNGQDDNPISGVTVALIPESKSYRLYQSTFTDQKGIFSFKGITPGDYGVMAFEDIEPGAFQDPTIVDQYRGKSEKLSLKENDRRAVTMKAIPRPN